MNFKTALILAIVGLACVMISFGGNPSLRMQTEAQEGRVAKDESDTAELKVVDYEADKIYKARGDSAIRLVGNVIFHHNGAIIQCDSAYRYDEKRMDCFGKVIINQDSTYIYGDMATYDGNINMAHVYAPLIKLIHGDAVLYTYNLKYNTKTSIADYERGGIMSQNTNFMESEAGVYDGNLSTIKLLNQVEMRNENYLIRTDSASFNMNTEVVTFLAKTYIWDSERDFLMADRGGYDTKAQVYIFTQNAYAMTPDQEMWADSMEYYSKTKEAFMQQNVQILDTTQQVLAFGDWGYYNDSLKNAILTRMPSIMAYETQGDTAYMRADSIFLYTVGPGMSHYVPGEEEDTVGEVGSQADSLSRGADSLASLKDSVAYSSDSLGVRGRLRAGDLDSLARVPGDSLFGGDSLSVDSLRMRRGSGDSLSRGADSVAMDGGVFADSLSLSAKDSLALGTTINNTKDNSSSTKSDKKKRKKQRAEKGVDTGSQPALVVQSPESIKQSQTPQNKDVGVSEVDKLNDTIRSEDLSQAPENQIPKDGNINADKIEDAIQSKDSTQITVNKDIRADNVGHTPKDTIDPDQVIASADKIDKIALSSKQQQKLDKKAERASRKLALKKAKAARNADSTAIDSLSGGAINGDSLALDSLKRDSLKLDSLAIDSLRIDSLRADSLTMAASDGDKDSMERVVRAYHNVKIFRSDFQAVADSVVGFSVDSVMNMYGRPILWAQQSQVTADQIDAYAKDEKLDWADFVGSPFITQEVDTSMYNQASGKEMRAFFLNNEMDFAELEGTVMNYYYMEDEDSLVVAFAVINCAMLTMYFENQEPTKMNWSGQPEWIIYPIQDIPSTQPQRLEGYTWSPQLRPANKEEITTRVVLPSIRVNCTAYKKPEFRIEHRINSYKKQILDDGIWSDRTDLPLVTAEYFVNRVLDY